MLEEIVRGIAGLSDPVLIGSGGFSCVYAATDTAHDRRVAVKVLNEAPNESTLRRFEQERRAMGRLSSHPNVVTILNSGTTREGNPFIVMELTDGGSLADLVEGGATLGWERALDYLTPVCDALAEAHDLGILHRDIKPENILLSRDHPLLTDFGIAHDLSATQTTTHIRASWLHSPPETFDNRRDTRSDIYSVGSTLYQLISGRPPLWRTGGQELTSLIWRLVNEVPPPLPPALAPAPVAEVIARTLAKDPADRPQTAAELATLLRQARSAGGSSPGAVGDRPTPGSPSLPDHATGPDRPAQPARTRAGGPDAAQDRRGGPDPGPGSPRPGGGDAGQARTGGLGAVAAESAHRLRLPAPTPPAPTEPTAVIDGPGPAVPLVRRAWPQIAAALLVLTVAVAVVAVTFR